MLKSTKIVLALGSLLGLSVAVLPTKSFAIVKIIEETDNVQVTVGRIFGFEVETKEVASASSTDPDNHPGATYDSLTDTYYATLRPGIDYSNDDLMTTTYRVVCNYITGTSEADSCAHGWTVSAYATEAYRDNGYAVMTPATYSETIVSNGSNALDGSVANWLMRLSSDDIVTLRGSTFATPSILRSSNAASPTPVSSTTGTATGTFVSIPASPTAVVSGESIATISGVSYYLGPRYFSVTYGLSAAASTTADTYTGQVQYVVSVDAS